MNEPVIVDDLPEWGFQGGAGRHRRHALHRAGAVSRIGPRRPARRRDRRRRRQARRHRRASRSTRGTPFPPAADGGPAPFRCAPRSSESRCRRSSRATRLCSRFHSSALGVRPAIRRRSSDDRSATAAGSPAPPTIVKVSRDSTTFRAEPRSSRRSAAGRPAEHVRQHGPTCQRSDVAQIIRVRRAARAEPARRSTSSVPRA